MVWMEQPVAAVSKKSLMAYSVALQWHVTSHKPFINFNTYTHVQYSSTYFPMSASNWKPDSLMHTASRYVDIFYSSINSM